MDSKEQTDKLIARLTDLTKSGKIHWEETVNRTWFLAGFADFVALVRKTEDVPDNYELEISDSFGKMIETIASSEAQTLRFAGLRQLYSIAQQRAMRSPRPLSDVLASLEQIR